MAEARKFADDNRHHFLGQILGVLLLDRVSSQPASDQRCVQIEESLPGILVRLQTQSLKQTDRSLSHGSVSLGRQFHLRPSLTALTWASSVGTRPRWPIRPVFFQNSWTPEAENGQYIG